MIVEIDQLPSGNYRARVMIARQRYTATFPTRREAEEWVLLTRAKAATGELSPRMTVEQYVQRWLDGTAATPVADRDHYRPHLEQYILPCLGRCQLVELIPSDISLLLTQVTKPLTTETADEVYRTAALFDAAVADGLLNRSPVTPRRSPSVRATRSAE